MSVCFQSCRKALAGDVLLAFGKHFSRRTVFGGYLGGLAFERGVKVDVFGESLDNAGFPWRDGRVVNGSRL